MTRALLMLALLLGVTNASAHPLAPALLELQEVAPGDVEVLWRTSVTRAGRSDVAPQLPEGCEPAGEVQAGLEEDAWVSRWTLHCEGGLVGRHINVHGLETSRIAVILRLQQQAGEPVQVLLDAREAGYTVLAPSAAPPAAAVFPSYFSLGVGHLLFGFDHLLFVCGLFLLVRGLRALVLTITAFTLGHSITLSLASLGWVQVPAAPMELGIALSLLWLACEIARPVGAPRSSLSQRPWLMAAGFGLLHGLGFAGALAEIGLPSGEIPMALLGFNLGIEAGQLALIGVLFMLKRLTQPRAIADFMPPLRSVPSYAIGTLAAYWCFERAAALFV